MPDLRTQEKPLTPVVQFMLEEVSKENRTSDPPGGEGAGGGGDGRDGGEGDGGGGGGSGGDGDGGGGGLVVAMATTAC